MVRCGDSQRLLPHMPPNKGRCPRCARANHVVSEKLNTRTTTRADCPPRTRADTPRCHDASRRRAGIARCKPSFLEDKTPDIQTGWAHLNAATRRRVGTVPRQTFDILRLHIFVYFVSVHHEHVDAITFLLVGTVSTSRQFDTDCGTVGRLEASNRETLRGSRVVLCGITRRDQLCFTHAHSALAPYHTNQSEQDVKNSTPHHVRCDTLNHPNTKSSDENTSNPTRKPVTIENLRVTGLRDNFSGCPLHPAMMRFLAAAWPGTKESNLSCAVFFCTEAASNAAFVFSKLSSASVFRVVTPCFA